MRQIVTLALPMLDIFGAENAGRRNRVCGFLRQGNGVAQAIDYGDALEPEMFWPTQLGGLSPETMAGRAVEVLQDVRGSLLMVRGVNRPFGDTGCGHATGAAQLLTAQKLTTDPGGSSTLALGESVDNRVARELNAAGREPLTLMAGDDRYTALPSLLSYRGARDRRGAETNPWNAYQKILGVTTFDESTVSEFATRRKSVNDLVRGQMQSLLGRKDLSAADRERLELHFSSIRDLETQLAACTPMAPERVQAIQQQSANYLDGDYVEQMAQLHIDVIAFALSCGYTSSATLQVGVGNDQARYVVNGERLPPFHQISHRVYSDGSTGDPLPGAQGMHSQIDRLHGRLFKRLIDRTNEYGILNRGVLAWVNDLANGPPHGDQNLPIIMAGNANGYLKQGQYVDAGGVTLNKLHNTLLNAVGVRKSGGSKVDDFGDTGLAKGEIAQMLA
ncbi:MAG: DUF1552 domain-containing protein [Polyangiales bacterium]